jgi:hypothetical protein
MLRGVKPSPELLEKLNDMNASFSFARAFVTNETVCIAMGLFAEELTPSRSPTRAG